MSCLAELLQALSEARGQLSRLQKELGESKNASFQQEDQMREARKAKREADQNNESLTVLLKEQQVKQTEMHLKIFCF